MSESEESFYRFEISDELKELITCKICNEKYENPIVLACFKTACLKHFTYTPGTKFQCKLCPIEHVVPENGCLDSFNLVKITLAFRILVK